MSGAKNNEKKSLEDLDEALDAVGLNVDEWDIDDAQRCYEPCAPYMVKGSISKAALQSLLPDEKLPGDYYTFGLTAKDDKLVANFKDVNCVESKTVAPSGKWAAVHKALKDLKLRE